MINKCLLTCFCVCLLFVAHAQRKVLGDKSTTTTIITKPAIPKEEMYSATIKKERYRIAVLSPMFLDSLEWEKDLRHLPKFMMPGIDFYQGVRIAADSLEKQGYKIDLYMFDSKSNYMNVKNMIESDKLDSMDVIIGNASVADLKLLANFAKQKKINFISAVSPSDAGQTANPYFTILQPRLASHIETMHKNIVRRYPEDNVVYIYGSATAELNGLGYFKNDVINNLPARFMEHEAKSDELDMKAILRKIDTNYNTVILLGTLDPETTYKHLQSLQPYARRLKLKVYCMPTTEAIKSLNKTDEFPYLPIFYTTSYMIDQVTPASQYISKKYKQKMGSIPSDIVYKGYESMYFFSNLLKKYGTPFNKYIGDNAYTFITPYKIVPVKENGSLMFYENKFLYLLKHEDGVMTYE
jgi:ABC-type branched-subunit amino acid transport system substrate-binding protein